MRRKRKHISVGLGVHELLECIRHWLLPKPQSDWLCKSEMQDAVTQQRNSEGDFKGDIDQPFCPRIGPYLRPLSLVQVQDL